MTPGRVRIGTWNLASRWSPAHRELLTGQDCELWLLTEVRDDVDLPGYYGHLAVGEMAPGRRWAGVFSRVPFTGLPDPHAASACAVVDGVTFCSAALPWRSCGPVPWGEGTHAERTARALDTLVRALPRGDLVWGGDWTHSLFGAEWAGSQAGRASLERGLVQLGLQVPTRDLPHRMQGVGTIDHIAVSRAATVADARRVSGIGPDGALSDHDAYVVEIAQERRGEQPRRTRRVMSRSR